MKKKSVHDQIVNQVTEGASAGHSGKQTFKKYLLIKRQSWHRIETSQLICSTNQLTGFYMMATMVFNELRDAF